MCELGGVNTHTLGRLATRGSLLVKRPLRAPDKFGAEHDVFLSQKGLQVVKFARKYLLKHGFTNLPARFGQNGLAWFQRDLGILIIDTAPDNFISAKQGSVPIDLQIGELNGSLLDLADAADAFFRQAPKPG